MPHVCCVYCGTLTQDLVDHLSRCSWDGMNEIGEPEKCYSCGKTDQSYSASQWTEDHPRCKACVKAGKKSRHLSFYFEAFRNHPSFDVRFQALRWACFEGRYEDALALLEEGVDPHIVTAKTIHIDVYIDGVDDLYTSPSYNIFHEDSGILYRVNHFVHFILYDERGQVIEDWSKDQPYNLLRACVFGISNISLEDRNKWAMVKLASLLIEKGLDKDDAKAYFESRYGDFADAGNEESPIKALYDVLSE